jgi:hypothetical protein
MSTNKVTARQVNAAAVATANAANEAIAAINKFVDSLSETTGLALANAGAGRELADTIATIAEKKISPRVTGMIEQLFAFTGGMSKLTEIAERQMHGSAGQATATVKRMVATIDQAMLSNVDNN